MSLSELHEVEEASAAGIVEAARDALRRIALAVNAYLPLLAVAGLCVPAAVFLAGQGAGSVPLGEIEALFLPLWLAASAVLLMMLGASLLAACTTCARFGRNGGVSPFVFLRRQIVRFDFLNRWVQLTLVLLLAGMTMAAGLALTGEGMQPAERALKAVSISRAFADYLPGGGGLLRAIGQVHGKVWVAMLAGSIVFFALRRGFCRLKVHFLAAFLLVWILGGLLGHPSMPVALAALVAIAAWELARPFGILMWVLAAVVPAGELLVQADAGGGALAGLIIAFSAWWLAEPLARRIMRRKPALLYRIMLRNRETLRLC